MKYSIQQLATLAGVSVRTLHYYDEVGLLSPVRENRNNYRQYGETELLRLQQILLYRELDFPLLDIKKILDSSNFSLHSALRDHRKIIEEKKIRLSRLLKTIDKTINKINHKNNMTDKELYEAFGSENYAEEAKQKWGHTDAYKQSAARVKKLTKEDIAQIKAASDALMKELVKNMTRSPKDPAVQKLIAKHYDSLRTFYEPNLQIYRGLAEMYIADKRFTANFEKYAVGLAQFMHDAMIFFVENQKNS
ncbi:MAG: MerR family transcriptional regulator [Patescibacteria group bacterium]